MSFSCQQDGIIDIAGGLNWNDLIWDNPEDEVSVTGTGTASQDVFTGSSINFSCFSSSGVPDNTIFNNSNSTSLLAYAGPLVNCVLTVTILSVSGTGNYNIDIKQDGGFILLTGPNSGSNSYPFVVSATVGSTFRINVNIDCGTPDSVCDFNVKLTPAF